MPQIESWFVIVMGLGTVFIGLICIILLCKILGAICNMGQQRAPASQSVGAPAAATAPIPATAASRFSNRQEVIAAIGAAIAEEAGVDVDAIRIVSIKRV